MDSSCHPAMLNEITLEIQEMSFAVVAAAAAAVLLLVTTVSKEDDKVQILSIDHTHPLTSYQPSLPSVCIHGGSYRIVKATIIII